jgi:hypothetical protein
MVDEANSVRYGLLVLADNTINRWWDTKDEAKKFMRTLDPSSYSLISQTLGPFVSESILPDNPGSVVRAKYNDADVFAVLVEDASANYWFISSGEDAGTEAKPEELNEAQVKFDATKLHNSASSSASDELPAVIATLQDMYLPWPDGTEGRDKDNDTVYRKDGTWHRYRPYESGDAVIKNYMPVRIVGFNYTDPDGPSPF